MAYLFLLVGADARFAPTITSHIMVNIIENRARITGTVKAVSIEPDARNLCQVSFEILSSSDLDDLPNLARADEGTTIQIRMQKSFIDENSIAPGAELTITVRKAFGQVYFLQER